MKNSWDARIARATELSSVYPFAAEVLRFYAQVAMLQQALHFKFQQAPTRFFNLDDASFGQLNPICLVQEFSEFLADVGEIAPPILAQAVARLAQKGSASWLQLVEECWLSPTASAEQDADQGIVAEQCLAWLFLQPCAEYLASRKSRVPADGSPARCPICGARPIVGVLRPEGEGARKSLVCMLCGHEWLFRRLYCPACSEEREPHLAFYSAPEIPHVRVDVCETCHTYLKSVDLTKTGLAIPIVDELAALPLDLWAREKGYHKLQMNIVGI
jgi:formate dehydrogenase accessory protein FdhE